MLRRVLFLLIICLIVFPCAADVFLPRDSSWRFYPGFSEASIPDTTAWRGLDFDDFGWISS